MNYQDMIKEIRAVAKRNGLTFKKQPRLTINGKQAWMFTSRKTGDRVIQDCTLQSAYEDCLSGAVASKSEVK